MTATPERTDGGDLLALCQENLVFRCDVTRGIDEGHLVPFHYFGVPDEVDYENIPWRNNRFDEEALTAAVATQKRAQNALDQYRRHTKSASRTLAFCCSQRHCDFMAEFFGQKGLRAVAVHSGPRSYPRAAALEQLGRSELDIVCAVDMFNEGIDVPSVDTVLMLRPTESTILWTQQFGRGLRNAQGKTHLSVIDYIGNHRIFLAKVRTLLNLPPGYAELDRALNLLRAGELALPGVRGATRPTCRARSDTSYPACAERRALPCRRAIDPWPILNAFAQAPANWIHQDVTDLFLLFVMITQSVIEEVSLPFNLRFGCQEVFPI
jgi:hypothetical protein